MMSNDTKICFYYPTTTLFIDDCMSFIENLSLKLNKNLAFKFLSNPIKAIEHLKNIENMASLKKSLFFFETIDDDFEQENEERINFNNILNMVYNKNRFSYITTLLLDYNMPEISGMKLSEILKENKINYKTIMLTGEATNDLAVKGFNENIIDKFITKGSDEMAENINSSIEYEQQKYFSEMSSSVSDILMSNNDFIFSEPHKKLFKTVQSKSIYFEYYLIDKFGSFVFFDIDAEPTWLIIRPENELNQYLHLIKDNEESEILIRLLEKKENMPVFINSDDFETPISQWVNKFYPCQRIQDTQYYYSLINGYEAGNLEKHKIKSYRSFLHDLKHNF